MIDLLQLSHVLDCRTKIGGFTDFCTGVALLPSLLFKIDQDNYMKLSINSISSSILTYDNCHNDTNTVINQIIF